MKAFDRLNDMIRACRSHGFVISMDGGGHYQVYNRFGRVASFSKNMKHRSTMNTIALIKNVTGIDIRREAPREVTNRPTEPETWEKDVYRGGPAVGAGGPVQAQPDAGLDVLVEAGDNRSDGAQRDRAGAEAMKTEIRTTLPEVLREMMRDWIMGVPPAAPLTIVHRLRLDRALLCANFDCGTLFEDGPCPSCASKGPHLFVEKALISVRPKAAPEPAKRAPYTGAGFMTKNGRVMSAAQYPSTTKRKGKRYLTLEERAKLFDMATDPKNTKSHEKLGLIFGISQSAASRIIKDEAKKK
jgi:hypothetical protein